MLIPKDFLMKCCINTPISYAISICVHLSSPVTSTDLLNGFSQKFILDNLTEIVRKLLISVKMGRQ